jgi:alpha-glucosidase
VRTDCWSSLVASDSVNVLIGALHIASRRLLTLRNIAATPMRWDDTPNAGFLRARYVALAANGRQLRANERRSPGEGPRIHALPHARPDPGSTCRPGGYCPAGEDIPEDCFVYLRTHEDQTIVVALTFPSEERTLTLPRFGTAEILVSTHLDREGTTDLARLRLRANERCGLALVRPGVQ